MFPPCRECMEIKKTGSWKNGEYNGKGTLYGITGDVIYEGNWKDGDYAE